MGARLNGKTAIVTGGASGIGAGTAEIMAQEGATVVIVDKDLEGAERQAEKIRRADGQAFAVELDLSNPLSIRAMVDESAARAGGIDVLFNNAAETRLSAKDASVEHTDIEVWDWMMQVNLRGTMLATKFAIPHMRRRGGGSIINTASGSGLLGLDRGTAYGVSKAGVIMLTKYVATQHGKENIRCNAIAPGMIETPALDPVSFGSGPVKDAILANTLTPRIGMPSDIAWAAVWLASDESAFVTGQCIQVDGGIKEHQPFWSDFRALAARPS